MFFKKKKGFRQSCGLDINTSILNIIYNYKMRYISLTWEVDTTTGAFCTDLQSLV